MGANRAHQPVVDAGNMKIEQLGIVVKDAHKTARRYAELMGLGPWMFVDFEFTDFYYRGQPVEDGQFLVRAALTQFGKMQIELLQPMYGPSTYASFLEKHGQGIHHLSLGVMEEHDQVVSALSSKGFPLEIQGVLGDRMKCTYVEMLNDLGVIFELAKDLGGTAKGPKPWGTLPVNEPGLIDTKDREISQVGIVVKDVEKTTKAYWELLGIGPWVFYDLKPPHISDCTLHEIKMIDHEDVHVRAALADFGSVQIELLEPVSGKSTYMEFLQTRGQGIHHVSLGETKDHDQVVSVLRDQGVGVEMDGLMGGGAFRFTYMATQQELGTVFEFVQIDPNKTNTLVPCGQYPP